MVVVVVLLLLWEGRTRGDPSYFGGLNPKLCICRVSTGHPSKSRVRGSLGAQSPIPGQGETDAQGGLLRAGPGLTSRALCVVLV